MPKKEVLVLKDLLGTNKEIASGIRTELAGRGILATNLLSGPGAGKTAILESLAERLKNEFRLAVVEGDIETERDAERIRSRGVEAWQITTHGACHLEAKMVGALFPEIPADLDFLFIENVGNLVCPANYDLGETLRFVLLSTPEGDDKPKKYPEAFLSADVFLLTKLDLLPHLPFDPDRARREALEINPRLEVFLTSARTGQGIAELADFLVTSLRKMRDRRA